MRNPGPGLPSLGHHHHQMGLPSGPQPPLPSHNNNMGRPALDRAHTFPTPPTSASSVMANMGSENFNWQGQGMNGPQGANPMTIDTGLSNARSMPTTPATTPPGGPLQNMQPYPSASQPYDSARQMYNAPQTQQSPYQQPGPANPQDRMYGQPNSYAKNEMGPPSSRPSASGPSAEMHDSKPPNGLMHGDHQPSQPHGDEEGEHEHDPEYTHDSGAYDASRSNYNYTAPGVGAMANDTNLSPEMTGSPGHPPGSGRATPRTTASTQSYYQPHTGYNTPPPRVGQTGSNLYSVISHDRTSANGTPGNDVYAPAPDLSGSMSNGYAPQPPIMNGATGSLKRGRDDDDLSRPSGDAPGSLADLKRRKTLESTVSAPSYDAMTSSRPASAISAPRR